MSNPVLVLKTTKEVVRVVSQFRKTSATFPNGMDYAEVIMPNGGIQVIQRRKLRKVA